MLESTQHWIASIRQAVVSAVVLAFLSFFIQPTGVRADDLGLGPGAPETPTPVMLVHMGEEWLGAGQNEQAAEHFRRALEGFQRDADTVGIAVAKGALGGALVRLGNTAAAESNLSESVELARRLGRNEIQAAGLNQLGNLYLQLGQPRRAMSHYRRVLDGELGDGMLRARVEFNVALAWSALGEPDQALAQLRQAATHVTGPETGQHRWLRVMTAGALMDLYESSHLPEAQGLAHGVLMDLLERGGGPAADSWRGEARGQLGRWHLSRGETEQAAALTREAIRNAQRQDYPERLVRWQWQLARILWDQGEQEAALAQFRDAAFTVEPVRLALVRQAAQTGRNGSLVTDLYRDYIDVLFKLADRVESEDRRTALLRESQTALENLKRAELENYYLDNCVAAFQDLTRGLGESLGEKAAALYPVVLGDRVEILLMRSGAIRKYRVPAPPATVLKALSELRYRLENRATREYLVPARQLYEWLIVPLREELERAAVTELVIVPDDRFAAVPFAALNDGRDFLIQKYAVAVVPGLSLTDPRPVRLSDVTLLAGGLDVPLRNYRELKYVSGEIRALADLFPGRIVFNDEFRTERVKNRLAKEDYSIVHLATHGVFAKRASDSFLLTYDGSLTVRDLDQSLAGSRFRDVPIEVLALSACETATGDAREAFGMAGLAVRAGARSALASLWVVNDEVSARLMPAFYRNLYERGLGRGQALRAAQLDMIDSEQFWHPAYWASYILIGNWQ